MLRPGLLFGPPNQKSWLRACLQPHIIFYGFSVMIQQQFFRVFQLYVQVKYFYQKKTLERVCKSYSFSDNIQNMK